MLREMRELDQPLTEQDVELFSKRHGLKLPTAYRKFLLAYNCGRPVPDMFSIMGMENNPRGRIQVFFGLKTPLASCDLDVELNRLKDRIPSGIVPIAMTGFDDYVILDMRKSGARVRFWDRRPFCHTGVWDEDDVYEVAENFEALLSGLSD